MDRFKFRVLDRRKNSYTDPINMVYCIDEDGNLCAPSNLTLKTMQPCETETVFLVEQCTGLKDKNGVLIFEGDRIMVGGDSDVTGAIVWHDGGYRMKYADNPVPARICSVNTKLYEITGNIHENPELLEVNNA